MTTYDIYFREHLALMLSVISCYGFWSETLFMFFVSRLVTRSNFLLYAYFILKAEDLLRGCGGSIEEFVSKNSKFILYVVVALLFFSLTKAFREYASFKKR